MNIAARQQINHQALRLAGQFDVLIVGAGISGIDAAYHLQTQSPQRSFALLECQDGFGGTWRTHKYPGIRSDSDLFTFGYKWKPWMGAPIATAEEIIKYLKEVIEERNLAPHIHYQVRVLQASWSSKENEWTIVARHLETDEIVKYTANFLWMCQGYYQHSEGYTPDWPEMDRYEGTIVHPQTWPDDLDYTDKDVLVIGSGATAATVIPAMSVHAKHVTMLQRSPTYFFPAPNANAMADELRDLEIPDEWTHEIVRRKILKEQQEITRRSFEEPEAVKQELFAAAKQYLGEDFDMSPHFTPNYRPWRQRLAFLPDGDLFREIKAGKVSPVTDQIDRFTEKGVLLESGQELTADIIVTATGFNMCILGDEINFLVDDQPVDFSKTITYRGIMFTGVPNLAWVFGYFRASWTLRADLVAELVCRIFKHMDDTQSKRVTPDLRPDDENMRRLPWIDSENFNPGYLTRSMDRLPSQGDREPWIFSQDYYVERDEFPLADVSDSALKYSR